MKSNTLIVIPAYNEEASIGELLTRSQPFADICVVNDASSDGTRAIVEFFSDVICISHQKNTHIPRTILDGMTYAFDSGYEYVVTMDAGLSHRPEELPQFLGAPHCDLLLGTRTNVLNLPVYRAILSKGAALAMNLALSRSLTSPASLKDVTSGYRKYSRKAIGLLLDREMKARSFDFHTEALMLIYRNGLSINEIEISYRFSNSSLNKTVFLDGVRMILDMLGNPRN